MRHYRQHVWARVRRRVLKGTVRVLPLIPVIVILIAISGCTTVEEKAVAVSPEDMVLRVADLPPGYTLSAEGAVGRDEIPPEYRDLGLTDGFVVSFFRANDTGMTGITQIVARYSPAGRDSVLPGLDGREGDGPGALQMTRLPDPGIGEAGEMYEVSSPPGAPVALRFYILTFVKGGMFETVMMTGNVTGADALLDVSRRAAAKIP
jgi:hypothetical protein